MQRALLPGMALALGVGCALGGILVPSPWPLLGAAASLALLLVRRSSAFLWATFLFLGATLGGQEAVPERMGRQLLLLREVRGTVISMPDRHEKTVSCVLEVPSLDVKLLAYLHRKLIPVPGDTLDIVGRFEAPVGGWGEYLRRRGIAGVFWVNEVRAAEPGPRRMAWVLYVVREKFLATIERSWPEDAGSVVKALLLGARGELNNEYRKKFRRAGVAHLLALSGLHLGIIAYGLWRLLGFLRLRPGRRYLLIFTVIALYVGLVGGRISLVRAGIMFGFLGLFWVLWEQGLVLRDWYDPLQGISAAAIVVLLMWPWSALDLGFQLSFAATAGIILGWPVWRDLPLRAKLPTPLRPAGDLLWVSLCAQAATLGFVGSAFGYISPYGILANLVLIPWTGIVIWSGLFLLVLSPLDFVPLLGAIASRYLISPYLAVVGWLSSLPGAVLVVGRHFGLWYAFAALVLVALRALAPETKPVLMPLTKGGRCKSRPGSRVRWRS